jgi:putative ABC transport system permease protein
VIALAMPEARKTTASATSSGTGSRLPGQAGAGQSASSSLLRQAADAYGVGSLGVPSWVLAAVPAGMLVLVAVAALLPAVRAGWLSAVAAIAAGRAPRPGRGYAAHRLLRRLPLPRPVSIGLAGPAARPARAAVTLVAVLLGAAAVTFAVGLSASLNRVVTGLSLAQAQPVQIDPSSSGAATFTAAQQRTLTAALRAQPGTAHYVAETGQWVGVAGLTGQYPLTAFRGGARWTGYDMISGHWYTGPGQAVVSAGFLNLTGRTVGSTVTFLLGGRHIPVRIVGQDFDAHDQGIAMLTDWQTLARAVPASLARPNQYDVGLRPGTSPTAYMKVLGARLGPGYAAYPNSSKSITVNLMTGLIGTLTLLLALVAALGVPASFLNVYHGWELAALGLAGVGIAVAAALLPAGWAAGIRTATALRAE